MGPRSKLFFPTMLLVVLLAPQAEAILNPIAIAKVLLAMLEDWFNTNKHPDVPLTTTELNYLNNLLTATGPRCTTRVEFRLLSREEFKKFANAARAIHDRSNVVDNSTGRTPYDLCVIIHRFAISPSAHDGCCFASWHAIFLIVFERALQTIDPTVCLTFADMRAEYMLTSHCLSNFHSDEYCGTPTGPVLSGVAAGWSVVPSDCETQYGKVLTRLCTPFIYDWLADLSYGVWEDICKNYTDYKDLCSTFNPNFEGTHGSLHMTKGGHVSIISCSVNDIIFWFIHGFVDMFWNVYARTRCQTASFAPGNYPKGYNQISSDHVYNAIAKPFTNWTCEEGLEVTSIFGISYVSIPSHCDTDAQCNHTPNNPKGFYCNSDPTVRRCIPKMAIGSPCTQSVQCFTEEGCASDATCLAGVCFCVPKFS